MVPVKVKCSRCKKTVDGFEGEEYTAGFYYVNEGFWSKYALPGETLLCDACMQFSKHYQEDYNHADT